MRFIGDSITRVDVARGDERGGAMLGHLYDRALAGERCWIRHDYGGRRMLPVHRWLGGDDADTVFDSAVAQMCDGPTIDLGCGPGRLLAELLKRGIPALGVDQSAAAVDLARRSGASVLRCDVFDPLPAVGCWQTVLLIDGNVGMGGDPQRLLSRVRQLLRHGGRCLAEFDSSATGVRTGLVRLESAHRIGPWFPWASIGQDCAARLAEQAGLALAGIHLFGDRVVASLLAP